MDTLLRDLRFAARTLAKTPGFIAIAVLALALGIGVNTAIFSVVDAVMLRPLPYANPDRLVSLQENSASLEGMSVAFPNYLDWKAQNQVFESLAARQSTAYNLISPAGDSSEPERVEGSNVTGNLFTLLGVSPVLGRTFTEAEDRPGAARVVVLNYGFWQRRFNRDANVLGKTLNLDDQPYTIIGVMPQGFRYPLTHLKGELWTSLGRFASEPNFVRDNHPGIYCVGRMKPGIPLEKARADMDTVAHRLEAQYPDTNKGHRVGIYFLHERIVRDIRPAMLIVTGAVWFVLLIACANVANLLLARAAARHQEIAIRTALGAGRGQLIRQLLTESTLLSLAGGLLGFLFALWGVQLLVTVLPPNLPRLSAITVDGRILLFTLALSLLTGLLFGVVPAWQVSRQGVSGGLKESSRSSGDIRRQRTRSGLMIAEIALSLVLLIGAGLMMKSFFRLSSNHARLQRRRNRHHGDRITDVQIQRPAAVDGVLQRCAGASASHPWST
jgi:putative ABC transport system permease protein